MDDEKIIDIDVSVIQDLFDEGALGEADKSRFSEDVLTSESKKVKRFFYTDWLVTFYRVEEMFEGDVRKFPIGRRCFSYKPTDEQLAFLLLEYEKEEEDVIATVEEVYSIGK